MVGLAGSACGGDDGTGGNGSGNGNGSSGDPLSIDAFDVSASSVRSGGTVTLTWEVSGATFLEVLQGDTALVTEEGDAAAGSGQVESAAINDVTTFTLVAANADDQQEETLEVTVQGIRIVEFSADPSSGVRSGDPVEMSWRIEGATVDSIEIRDEDDEVPVGPDDQPIDPRVGSEGSVTVQVIGDVGSTSDTKTYTLRAVGGGGEATRSLDLDVEVALPVIDTFTTSTDGTEFVVGADLQIRWSTRNAERVVVFKDGLICSDDESVENERNNTSTCGTVEEGGHTIEIRAGNANTPVIEDAPTQIERFDNFVGGDLELQITSVEPPVVESFDISPDEYWEGVRDVTATWDTSNATRVELQQFVPLGQTNEWCPLTQNPTPPCPAFDLEAPTSPDGNFTFELEGGQIRDYRVEAILEDENGNRVDSSNQTARVQGNYDEPDSSQMNPLLIAGNNLGVDQRATIDNQGDEDWFAVDVPANGRIFARAGVGEFDLIGGSAECRTEDDNPALSPLADTAIELFDEDGNSLGTASGNTFDRFLGDVNTTCAVMAGHLHPFAMGLDAGRYLLKVTGEDLRTGDYTFNVQVFEPPPAADTDVNPNPGTSPQWEVEGVTLTSMPLGPPFGPVVWPLASHGFNNNPQTGSFWRLSIQPIPLTPHDRDYGTELEVAFQAAGLKVNRGFTPTDLGCMSNSGSCQAGGDRFLVLSYTVVGPSDTSSTTVDYRNPDGSLGATGPFIPFDAFPFSTDTHTFGKSFEPPLVDDNNNPPWDPSTEMPLDPITYTVVEGDREDAVGGVSHRHFWHFMSVNLDTYPGFQSGQALSIPNPAGQYVWTVILNDDTGAGYTIKAFFTL